jgi:hypothetical protein
MRVRAIPFWEKQNGGVITNILNNRERLHYYLLYKNNDWQYNFKELKRLPPERKESPEQEKQREDRYREMIRDRSIKIKKGVLRHDSAAQKHGFDTSCRIDTLTYMTSKIALYAGLCRLSIDR